MERIASAAFARPHFAAAVPLLLVLLTTSWSPAASLTPGQILQSLGSFDLQLPVARGSSVLIIKGKDVLTYSDQYFYVRGNAVVLKTPANGATTPGSKHPRTELREVDSSGDGARWGVSWSSERILKFSGKVTVLAPENTVAIAQIKSDSKEPLQLRVEAYSSGKAKVMAWIDDKSDKSPIKLEVARSYKIGDLYQIGIKAGNGKLSITFNDQTVTYKYYRPEKSGCYFKVGNYLQTSRDSEVELSSLELRKA